MHFIALNIYTGGSVVVCTKASMRVHMCTSVYEYGIGRSAATYPHRHVANKLVLIIFQGFVFQTENKQINLKK